MGTKNPGGRPLSYNEKFHCKLGHALAARGLNDLEISKELEIADRTFYRWIKDKPKFCQAIWSARNDPVSVVKNALFERAKGFEYTAQKPMIVAQGNGMGSNVELVDYTERVLPDVSAIKFYLTNRDPENWKERQDVNHSGEINIPPPMTREEREARKKELLDRAGKSE
jgi:hypothetical protein